MSWFYFCGHMPITISNTISSSNIIPKNMLTYVKSCDYLDKDVCESILVFHAITGSDTTSYFFRASKVKTFKKKFSNQTKLKLIKELGKKDKLFDNHMKSAKEFIRSVIYAGGYKG